jgi:hypothetical protein
MQKGKRGDVDGVEDGALLEAKDLRSLGRKALPPSAALTQKAATTRTSSLNRTTPYLGMRSTNYRAGVIRIK